MELTYPTIVNYNFGPAKDKISILDSISNKLSISAEKVINEKRFLVQSNIDWELIDDLYIYRDIYIRKINCDSCLKKYSLERIKSKIYSITNKNNC